MRLSEAEEQELLRTLGLHNARLIYEEDTVILDKVVPAGIPIDLGDDSPEYKDAIKRIMRMGSRVLLEARGASMIGAGIESGDMLEITLVDVAEDGDVVVASLDGQETVKYYYEDEDGEKWLIPANDDFEPINMATATNARIIAKVVRIVKNTKPHGNQKDLQRRINKVRKSMEAAPPSNRKIAKALKEVVDMIRNSRQWFSIYSVLYHRSIVATYGDFVSLLQDIMGEEAPSLDIEDLRKMEVESFSKPYYMWDEGNAPVTGKRFNDYLSIARTFSKGLS